MTTNAPPIKQNKLKLPHKSPVPHQPKVKYPTHSSKIEVVIHRVPKKKKCPYCSLCSDEGYPLTNGEDFASNNDKNCSINIAKDKRIEFGIDVNGSTHFGASIKIKYCPFCRREL